MARAKRVTRKLMYQGRVIKLFQETFYVGRQKLVREVVTHPGAAVIVPLTDDGNVVMVRQYRRAADRMLLELPAGTLSPGEPALTCARRELEEETGWKAKRWSRLIAFYAAPGMLSEWMVIFLATGLTKAAAHPEADEILTPVSMPLQRALAKIGSGAICDAKSIIGLLMTRDLLAAGHRRGKTVH